MNLFSAKFSLVSVISYTLDTWSVTADVIDNMGLFYASDASVNDIVYCDGTDQNLGVRKFRVSEISAAVGARLTCKLTCLDSVAAAPIMGRDAIIGTTVNGIFIMPGRAVQGLNDTFISYVRNVENITIMQTIVMQPFNVVGEPLPFNLTTNIATTQFAFLPESVAVYMRGQRLTKDVDFEILNGEIHSLDQVSAFDAYQIDYLKDTTAAPIGQAVIGESFIVG